MPSLRSTSRLASFGRRAARFLNGIFALCLIAGLTYTFAAPKSAPVHLANTQLTAYSATYYADETYGGTNPVENCTTCDAWGKPDTGTASLPLTNDPDEMVNPATGDLAESYTLFSDPDPGFNLQYKLSYDSEFAQYDTYLQGLLGTSNQGTNGWGWRTDGGTTMDVNSSGLAQIILPTQAEIDFAAIPYPSTTCPPGGSVLKTVPGSTVYNYCAAPRVDAEFGYNATAGVYILLLHGGRQEITYYSDGQVEYEGTLQDPGSIHYSYILSPTSNPNCVTPPGTITCLLVSDQLGRNYSDALNSAGVAIEMRDPNSQIWPFGYDGSGNLTLVFDPNSHLWRFGYDTVQAPPDQHDLNSVEDPNNHTTAIGYTPAGTNGGYVASVTDAMGNATRYSGWDQATLICGCGTSYSTTINYPTGEKVVDEYTAFALNSQTTSGPNPAYNQATYYIHNVSAGLPTLNVQDPTGNVTLYTTDLVGNVLSVLNNTYGTTTTAYNSYDEPCWTTLPTAAGSVPSGPTCSNEPTGTGTTYYTYDAYGNLTKEVDPTGVATYSGYDIYGQLCWQTIPGTAVSGSPPCSSPPAASSRYNYNAGSELLAETTPDGIGASFTYDTTTYTYNAYGQVLTEVSPDGNVSGGTPANYRTTLHYDNAGRLYEMDAPMTRDTVATLDAVGNVDTVTDPYGNVSSFGYDPDNRQCWSYQGTVSVAPVCLSPPIGASQSLLYFGSTDSPEESIDPDGNATTYTYANSNFPSDPTTVTDGSGHITSNVYDKDGNLCVTGTETTSLYSGAAPTCVWPGSGYTFDSFDSLGNVTSSKDPNGLVTGYARTNDNYPGNVTTVTPASGGGQAATGYGYDLDGRLVYDVEGTGAITTTTYTPAGQKCWQAPVYVAGAVCSTPPSTAGTSDYTYYNSQRLYFMSDVTASTVNYTSITYDAQGQETEELNNSGAVTYGYDFAGDNTCVSYPVISGSSCATHTGSIVTYGYDADGRMKTAADWSGNSFTFGYDSHSNPTSIGYPTSTGWTEQSTYDAANDLTDQKFKLSTYTQNIPYVPNADNLDTSQNGLSYSYNAKNQVSGGGDAILYNPNGELATDTPTGGSGTALNYDPDTELTSTTGAIANTYAYNANGDRCAKKSGAVTLTCTTAGATTAGWTNYNQLCYMGTGTASCTATPGTGVSLYSYDGTGARVSDNINGVSQNFAYDTVTRSGQPLITTDGSDAYIYGPAGFGGGTAPIEQISLSTGTPSYLFSLPTGVDATVSSAGVFNVAYGYSAYGLPTTSGSGITTRFGFEGAYTDPSGFLYLINRYYDPATDQFLNVDPEVMETGQPYAFSEDDPVNGSDPLGLRVQGPPGVTCDTGGPDAICTGPGQILGENIGQEVAQQTAAAAGRSAAAAMKPAPTISQSGTQFSGSCTGLIVQHCTYSTTSGQKYSSWGVGLTIGYAHEQGVIYNQNGSKTSNKCEIENYMHGWSVSGGVSVGPVGITFDWGGVPQIESGDAGVQIDEGFDVLGGPILSYAFGPSCK
jgi:RHS repeat-associated protein